MDFTDQSLEVLAWAIGTILIAFVLPGFGKLIRLFIEGLWLTRFSRGRR